MSDDNTIKFDIDVKANSGEVRKLVIEFDKSKEAAGEFALQVEKVVRETGVSLDTLVAKFNASNKQIKKAGGTEFIDIKKLKYDVDQVRTMFDNVNKYKQALTSFTPTIDTATIKAKLVEFEKLMRDTFNKRQQIQIGFPALPEAPKQSKSERTPGTSAGGYKLVGAALISDLEDSIKTLTKSNEALAKENDAIVAEMTAAEAAKRNRAQVLGVSSPRNEKKFAEEDAYIESRRKLREQNEALISSNELLIKSLEEGKKIEFNNIEIANAETRRVRVIDEGTRLQAELNSVTAMFNQEFERITSKLLANKIREAEINKLISKGNLPEDTLGALVAERDALVHSSAGLTSQKEAIQASNRDELYKAIHENAGSYLDITKSNREWLQKTNPAYLAVVSALEFYSQEGKSLSNLANIYNRKIEAAYKERVDNLLKTNKKFPQNFYSLPDYERMEALDKAKSRPSMDERRYGERLAELNKLIVEQAAKELEFSTKKNAMEVAYTNNPTSGIPDLGYGIAETMDITSQLNADIEKYRKTFRQANEKLEELFTNLPEGIRSVFRNIEEILRRQMGNFIKWNPTASAEDIENKFNELANRTLAGNMKLLTAGKTLSPGDSKKADGLLSRIAKKYEEILDIEDELGGLEAERLRLSMQLSERAQAENRIRDIINSGLGNEAQLIQQKIAAEDATKATLAKQVEIEKSISYLTDKREKAMEAQGDAAKEIRTLHITKGTSNVADVDIDKSSSAAEAVLMLNDALKLANERASALNDEFVALSDIPLDMQTDEEAAKLAGVESSLNSELEKIGQLSGAIDEQLKLVKFEVRGFKSEFAVLNLSDIPVGSPEFEAKIKHIQEVFEKLKKNIVAIETITGKPAQESVYGGSKSSEDLVTKSMLSRMPTLEKQFGEMKTGKRAIFEYYDREAHLKAAGADQPINVLELKAKYEKELEKLAQLNAAISKAVLGDAEEYLRLEGDAARQEAKVEKAHKAVLAQIRENVSGGTTTEGKSKRKVGRPKGPEEIDPQTGEPVKKSHHKKETGVLPKEVQEQIDNLLLLKETLDKEHEALVAANDIVKRNPARAKEYQNAAKTGTRDVLEAWNAEHQGWKSKINKEISELRKTPKVPAEAGTTPTPAATTTPTTPTKTTTTTPKKASEVTKASTSQAEIDAKAAYDVANEDKKAKKAINDAAKQAREAAKASGDIQAYADAKAYHENTKKVLEAANIVLAAARDNLDIAKKGTATASTTTTSTATTKATTTKAATTSATTAATTTTTATAVDPALEAKAKETAKRKSDLEDEIAAIDKQIAEIEAQIKATPAATTANATPVDKSKLEENYKNIKAKFEATKKELEENTENLAKLQKELRELGDKEPEDSDTPQYAYWHEKEYKKRAEVELARKYGKTKTDELYKLQKSLVISELEFQLPPNATKKEKIDKIHEIIDRLVNEAKDTVNELTDIRDSAKANLREILDAEPSERGKKYSDWNKKFHQASYEHDIANLRQIDQRDLRNNARDTQRDIIHDDPTFFDTTTTAPIVDNSAQLAQLAKLKDRKTKVTEELKAIPPVVVPANVKTNATTTSTPAATTTTTPKEVVSEDIALLSAEVEKLKEEVYGKNGLLQINNKLKRTKGSDSEEYLKAHQEFIDKSKAYKQKKDELAKLAGGDTTKSTPVVSSEAPKQVEEAFTGVIRDLSTINEIRKKIKEENEKLKDAMKEAGQKYGTGSAKYLKAKEAQALKSKELENINAERKAARARKSVTTVDTPAQIDQSKVAADLKAVPAVSNPITPAEAAIVNSKMAALDAEIRALASLNGHALQDVKKAIRQFGKGSPEHEAAAQIVRDNNERLKAMRGELQSMQEGGGTAPVVPTPATLKSVVAKASPVKNQDEIAKKLLELKEAINKLLSIPTKNKGSKLPKENIQPLIDKIHEIDAIITKEVLPQLDTEQQAFMNERVASVRKTLKRRLKEEQGYTLEQIYKLMPELTPEEPIKQLTATDVTNAAPVSSKSTSKKKTTPAGGPSESEVNSVAAAMRDSMRQIEGNTKSTSENTAKLVGEGGGGGSGDGGKGKGGGGEVPAKKGKAGALDDCCGEIIKALGKIEKAINTTNKIIGEVDKSVGNVNNTLKSGIKTSNPTSKKSSKRGTEDTSNEPNWIPGNNAPVNQLTPVNRNPSGSRPTPNTGLDTTTGLSNNYSFGGGNTGGGRNTGGQNAGSGMQYTGDLSSDFDKWINGYQIILGVNRAKKDLNQQIIYQNDIEIKMAKEQISAQEAVNRIIEERIAKQRNLTKSNRLEVENLNRQKDLEVGYKPRTYTGNSGPNEVSNFFSTPINNAASKENVYAIQESEVLKKALEEGISQEQSYNALVDERLVKLKAEEIQRIKNANILHANEVLEANRPRFEAIFNSDQSVHDKGAAAAALVIQLRRTDATLNEKSMVDAITKAFQLQSNLSTKITGQIKLQTSSLGAMLRELVTTKGALSNFFGVSMAMIGFQIQQLVTDFITTVIANVEKLQTAIVGLSVAEVSMSKQGIEVTGKNLLDLVDRLEKKFTLISHVDMLQTTADTALRLSSLGIGPDGLEKIMTVANLAKIKRPGVAVSDITNSLLTAIASNERETIKKYGYDLTKPLIQAKAKELGYIKDINGALTTTQSTQAAINVLYEKALQTQEELLASQQSLYNASTALNKEWTDLSTKSGGLVDGWNGLLLAVADTLKTINNMIGATEKLEKPASRLEQIFHALRYGAVILVAILTAAGALIASIFLTGGTTTLPLLAGIALAVAAYLTGLEKAYQTKQKILEQGSGGGTVGDTPTADKIISEQDAAVISQRAKDMVKSIKDIAKAMEDLDKKAKKSEEDFTNSMKKMAQDFATESAKFFLDWANDRQKIITDSNAAIAKAEIDWKNKQLDDEAKFQFDLQKLKNQYLFNLDDAIAARDARAVLALQRQYVFDKKNMIDEHGFNKKNDAKNHAAEMARLVQERNDRIAELNKERAIKWQQMQEDYALKQKEAIAQHAAEMKAIEQERKDKLKEMTKAMAEQYGITAKGEKALYDLMYAYYGPGKAIDQLLKYSSDSQTAFFEELARRAEAIRAAHSSGTSSSTSSTGSSAPVDSGNKANGGVVIADRPTTATFGERTKELALFIPMDKLGGMLGNSSAPDTSTSKNGIMELLVTLSPDLETRIVRKSMDGMADTIMQVRKAR